MPHNSIRAVFKIGMLLGVLFMLWLTTGCKKEEHNNWQRCIDCPTELIVGEYTGKANHVKRLDTLNFITTSNKDAYLNINATGSGIAVQCGVVNLFSASFSGNYQNSHFITLQGSSSVLNCNVWRDGEKVKIVGTAKKLLSSGETAELLDFTVYKKQR